MASAAPAPKRRGGMKPRRAIMGGGKRLEGEDASTAALEAIVFGRPLQLPSDNEGDGSGVDESPVAGMDDSEGNVPLLAAVDQADSLKPGRPKAKRKRKIKKKRAQEESDEDEASGGEAPAWNDPDDAELEVDLTARNRTKKLRRHDDETVVAGADYEQRLREQFVKMNGTADWAEKRPGDRDADASSDSEQEELFREAPATSANPIAASTSRGLQPAKVDIKCLQRVDIPALEGGEKAAVVQSLQFHPDSELMMTAGLDKTLRIFAVDGTENAKVASYHFKKFPITSACFTPNGNEILITGRNHRMWGLDVRTGEPMRIEHHNSIFHKKYGRLIAGPCPADAPSLRANNMYAVMGDAGTLLVCDVTSKQPIRTLRMSVPGVAAVFSAERDVMYSADSDQNIYEWDLATGRCVQRVKATWATGIESLALRRVTPNAPTPVLAVGTTTGNIDLYDLSKPHFTSTPYKSFDHLTTMVTCLKFHPEGELLLGASKFKKEALKLMHCATGTVFQNWPTAKTPLNRVTSVDFSRSGGMLAMANERGKVLLYQLRHYEKMA